MEVHARGAVIVCEHVAEMGYPILRGKRDEPDLPDFPEDTGWQFLCNRHRAETRALVWALKEIVAREPGLDEFLDCPPGSEIVRSEADQPWMVLRDNHSTGVGNTV